MTATVPSAEALVELIRTSVEELSHVSGVDKTFEELDLDSLSMVEIATIVGQTYGVPLGEEEVVEAGNFITLTELVQARVTA
ncbi:acyl carrier protein [Curtobacterium sp. MCLR17_031]|uniref:acyl carrier protein n=1 Tax=Curtobacterium sp. MCLR17_031 TaxID=2175622 RepID=UPI000DA9438C|nr:acyl carrier protein [Curtobacterium sp. MCLR17_031]WIE58258.1 acyl carrier protein [Curtobacterium sp. MCLR17_031]